MDITDVSKSIFDCGIITATPRRKGNTLYYRICSIDEENIYCVEILDKMFNMSKEITTIKINDYMTNYEYSDSSFHLLLKLGFKREYITSTGGVYLIKSNDIYKIGRSKNIKTRIIGLKSQLKANIELIVYHRTLGHYEKRIHKLYSKESIGGEWFNLNESQVNDFINKNFIDKITF